MLWVRFPIPCLVAERLMVIFGIGKVGMSVLTKGLAMDFERQGRKDMAITSIWPAVVRLLPYLEAISLLILGHSPSSLQQQETRSEKIQQPNATYANPYIPPFPPLPFSGHANSNRQYSPTQS
jgi:hypothetical protein